MKYNPKDHYFQKAKDEGFAARSVYKLQEIDAKFKLVKQGHVVADLGCAPGSWSQWVSQKVGPQGKVIGWDLTAVNLKLKNAIFYQIDLLQTDLPDFLSSENLPTQVDGVVSDMAPRTTGIRDVDQARSLELCEMAFQQTKKILKPHGYFVCKFFQSGDFNSYRAGLRSFFDRVEVVKPQSTRSRSFEVFLVGINFKESK
jgi:23S rRNA (uridine2552-2'-O)-methyltransferase